MHACPIQLPVVWHAHKISSNRKKSDTSKTHYFLLVIINQKLISFYIYKLLKRNKFRAHSRNILVTNIIRDREKHNSQFNRKSH